MADFTYNPYDPDSLPGLVADYVVALGELGALRALAERNRAEIWVATDHLGVTERRETVAANVAEVTAQVAELTAEVDGLAAQIDMVKYLAGRRTDG